MLETRNDIATLVNYLGALAGDHVVLPLPADGDHSADLDAYDPDVIVRDGVDRAPPPTRPRAAPRPGPAAVHVGQHRVAEAGAPVAGPT